MNPLDDSFAILLGRQATDQEKQALQRVKEALGIKPNDALWLVLMALEHYQKLYSDIPGRIQETTQSTLYSLQATADAVMREAASVTKMELAQAVADTAEKMARDTATTQKWRWMIGSIAVGAVMVLVAAGAGYLVGKEVAQSEATAIARQEAGAVSWAMTPDGQLAHRWAQMGELQRLARCEDQTLTRDRQQGRAVCLAKKGSGWWLP